MKPDSVHARSFADRKASLCEHRYGAGAATGGCGPYRETTLLDGTPFAFWTGVAAVGSQLFVGAGAQGLLRFQVEARGFRMLPSVNLGDCLDVVASGCDVVALVGDAGGRRIVQLRPDLQGGLQGIAEIEVEERVRKLVGQAG